MLAQQWSHPVVLPLTMITRSFVIISLTSRESLLLSKSGCCPILTLSLERAGSSCGRCCQLPFRWRDSCGTISHLTMSFTFLKCSRENPFHAHKYNVLFPGFKVLNVVRTGLEHWLCDSVTTMRYSQPIQRRISIVILRYIKWSKKNEQGNK